MFGEVQEEGVYGSMSSLLLGFCIYFVIYKSSNEDIQYHHLSTDSVNRC